MGTLDFEILGDPPFRMEVAEQAMAELRSVLPEAVFETKTETRSVYKDASRGDEMARCGIRIHYEGEEADIETITVQSVRATALGWTFRRAWYYWACSTKDKPVPEEMARSMNEKWGEQVRVDGFSGGRDAIGDVFSYHVDTKDGLAALVTILRQVQV